MTSLSYTSTCRLAIWRELHARAGFLQIFAALIAVGAALPRGREAWQIFVLVLILPPLTIALALRVPAQADSFWRGLGGHGSARALGTAAVHLAMLLGTAYLVDLPGLFDRDRVSLLANEELRLLYPCFLCCLWALVFAGRAVSAGLVAIAPLLVGGTGIFAVTFFGDALHHWPSLTAVHLRMVLIGATGLVCGLLLDEGVGPWGGAIAKRGLAVLIVPMALVFVLLGSLAVEAVTPPHWGIAGAQWTQVASDGSVGLRHAPRDRNPWTPWSPWIQRWTPEGGLAWWHRSDQEEIVTVGPKGAVLLGDTITWPNGTSTRCGVAADVMNWSPDGAAAALLARPAVEQVGAKRTERDSDTRWLIAQRDGCTKMPPSVRWAVALDGETLLWVEGNGLHLGRAHEGARSLAFPDGKQSDRVSVRAGATITMIHRQVETEHSLWMLRGDSLVALATKSAADAPDPRFSFRFQRTLAEHQLADGCASSDGSLSCWNEAGHRVVGPLSDVQQEGLFFLGRGWVWDQGKGFLLRPTDGARVQLAVSPAAAGAEGGTPEVVVLLPEGGVRHFSAEGQVHDIPLPD